MGHEKSAAKAMDVHTEQIGEENYSAIMELLKNNPRYIPYNEVFTKADPKHFHINSNAVEMYIEEGRKIVPSRYKPMFDCFSVPGFRHEPAKNQLADCNTVLKIHHDRANAMRAAQGRKQEKYTPYTLEEFGAFDAFVRTHHKVKTAMNMAKLHRSHAEHFVDDLERMRMSALESGKPADMKAYQETFMKVSDFYMKNNFVYEKQKLELDVSKFKRFARISRQYKNLKEEDGSKGKVITISDENYERGKKNGDKR